MFIHKKRESKVPNESIRDVLQSVYNNFKPTTGDIQSRYHIEPEDCKFNSYLDKINYEVVGIIVTDVKTNFATEEKILNSVYGIPF